MKLQIQNYKMATIVFLLGILPTVDAMAQIANTPPAQPQTTESVLSLLIKGGPIMIPLALCSIIGLTITLERFINLRRGKIISKNFFAPLKEILEDPNNHSLEKGVEYCNKRKTPIARIIRAGLIKWKLENEFTERPNSVGETATRETEIEKTIAETASREVGRMKISLRSLKVIAAISPLLGLLGTVYGMIRAFQTVAASTVTIGRASKLASGIYEAMVTTATGLTIAIPVLIIFYYFNTRVDNYADDIEVVCDNFLDEFVKSQRRKNM